MTGWTRASRTPSSLRRWINTLCTALHCWAWPYRRLHDACLALSQTPPRSRPPVRLCLEDLEDRQLLDANSAGLAARAFLDDVAQFHYDQAASATALVNAAQSSPANATPPASVANQGSRRGAC
jgi:hypothetical protein